MQTFDELKNEKNHLKDLDLHEIFKNPNWWHCDLMIAISSMKEFAALTIASMDDYCAVIETPEGIRILFEPSNLRTHMLIKALEEAGLTDIKVAKSFQNLILSNDIHQLIEV
jgi:hypothetical protein